MDADKSEASSEKGTVKKSPWNSLEVAKLIMSAATPLALFALGLKATQIQDQRASDDKRLERKFAEHLRDEGIRRDEKLREAALGRDDALRQAAETRDDDLRREANVRDDALRAQAFQIAKSEKIIEKRAKFWDEASPKVALLFTWTSQIHLDESKFDIKHSENDVNINPEDVTGKSEDDYDKALQECNVLIHMYGPYLSPKFIKAFTVYVNFSSNAVSMMPSDRLFSENNRLYSRLISAASEDLGQRKIPTID